MIVSIVKISKMVIGHDKRNPMRVHVANDFTMKKISLSLRSVVI